MNLKILIAAGLMAGITPAIAADPGTAPGQPALKPARTVAQCLSILVALRNLDGHVVITKQNGQDVSVMQPWVFGSGVLRLKIANNITALAGFETSLEAMRQAIVKEGLARMPADKDGNRPNLIPPGTPEFEAFQRQYNEALNSACDVKLARFKLSELKLDNNEIPVTVLSALSEVIDDDQSK